LPATTIPLGPITIHRIVEQERVSFFDARKFFPTLTDEIVAEHRSWLVPNFIDEAGNVVLCVQSYLVETPQHKILVDTCVGNDKERPGRPVWHRMKSEQYHRNLAAHGFRVEDIDFVMCTHLHVDHVGWNTRLDNGRWVPTFPNARYLFAHRELEFWTKRQQDDPASCPWVTDSVLPIIAAQRADVIKSAHQFSDLVSLIPTPGHTIDHFSVHVGKQGNDAVITGDMIHSPIQARYPEIGMMSDYDSRQAGATRRSLFGRFCDTATLICTAHFPSSCCGHLRRWKDGFDIVAG
jgi:glyoxylase-like metal-dependent hydrolase (beta-lactamase superfamily II)